MTDLLEMYPQVIETLSILASPSSDTKTLTEAQGLLHYFQTTPFVVALVISEHMLGFTKQLSVTLQGERHNMLRDSFLIVHYLAFYRQCSAILYLAYSKQFLVI